MPFSATLANWPDVAALLGAQIHQTNVQPARARRASVSDLEHVWGDAVKTRASQLPGGWGALPASQAGDQVDRLASDASGRQAAGQEFTGLQRSRCMHA